MRGVTNTKSSGGHTIIDPSDLSMTQRAGLQFTDAHLSDDSINNATDVEFTEVISQSDFDDLDETDSANEGQYLVEIPNNASILTASQVAYSNTSSGLSAQTVQSAIDELATNESVSVTADGVKTYSQLLSSLYSQITVSKVSNLSTVQAGSGVYRLSARTSNLLQFTCVSIGPASAYYHMSTIRLESTGHMYTLQNTTYTTNDTDVPANGTVITFTY